MGFGRKIGFFSGIFANISVGITKGFRNAGMRLAVSYRNEVYRKMAESWLEDQSRKTSSFVGLGVTALSGLKVRLGDFS